jgi:hypothetical protein
MAVGRPLNLTAEEKEKLTLLARRPKTGQALAMRARMVLGCSDGRSNGVVARRLRVTGCNGLPVARTIPCVDRLEGLLDESRPGRRDPSRTRRLRKGSPTLESMPVHSPVHSPPWSTRRMAQKNGLSQTASVRIGRAFGWQPHRVEHFKFSQGPRVC